MAKKAPRATKKAPMPTIFSARVNQKSASVDALFVIDGE
jgi:hypothetical protein